MPNYGWPSNKNKNRQFNNCKHFGVSPVRKWMKFLHVPKNFWKDIIFKTREIRTEWMGKKDSTRVSRFQAFCVRKTFQRWNLQKARQRPRYGARQKQANFRFHILQDIVSNDTYSTTVKEGSFLIYPFMWFLLIISITDYFSRIIPNYFCIHVPVHSSTFI